MNKLLLFVCQILLAGILFSQDQLLNIVVPGAHPDDCEADAGGATILFARMGYRIKFVSLTNGDAGHFEMGGGALAKVR